MQGMMFLHTDSSIKTCHPSSFCAKTYSLMSRPRLKPPLLIIIKEIHTYMNTDWEKNTNEKKEGKSANKRNNDRHTIDYVTQFCQQEFQLIQSLDFMTSFITTRMYYDKNIFFFIIFEVMHTMQVYIFFLLRRNRNTYFS